MSPIVKKKDSSVRFCIDYRMLNSLTTSDSYPIPCMEELANELGSNKVFSIFDACSAWRSIELNLSNRSKTAFSDGIYLWQFHSVLYGLKTTGMMYQCMLSPVLSLHTLAYLDDVVVYSSNFDGHVRDLNETWMILENAWFKMNVNKCQFPFKVVLLHCYG